MKVGVLSDIHGNHYALKQVLESARNEKVEKLLILGDLVGYYYHPEIVLSLISEWDYELIKGNHEILLQELKDNKLDAKKVKAKYGSGHELALKVIDSDTLQWLFSLPSQKTVVIDNVSFQLNHGSPSSIDEYIYPDAKTDQLEKCNSTSHDFILIGHSHYSFSYKCKDCILINCGSVGQSRQNGGLAYWTIINTENKSFETRVNPYDTSELLNEIKLIDPDFKYASEILQR